MNEKNAYWLYDGSPWTIAYRKTTLPWSPYKMGKRVITHSAAKCLNNDIWVPKWILTIAHCIVIQPSGPWSITEPLAIQESLRLTQLLYNNETQRLKWSTIITLCPDYLNEYKNRKALRRVVRRLDAQQPKPIDPPPPPLHPRPY